MDKQSQNFANYFSVLVCAYMSNGIYLKYF